MNNIELHQTHTYLFLLYMFGHNLREQNITTEGGEGLAVGCLCSSMPFTTEARHQTGWASGVYTYFIITGSSLFHMLTLLYTVTYT